MTDSFNILDSKNSPCLCDEIGHRDSSPAVGEDDQGSSDAGEGRGGDGWDGQVFAGLDRIVDAAAVAAVNRTGTRFIPKLHLLQEGLTRCETPACLFLLSTDKPISA